MCIKGCVFEGLYSPKLLWGFLSRLAWLLVLVLLVIYPNEIQEMLHLDLFIILITNITGLGPPCHSLSNTKEYYF